MKAIIGKKVGMSQIFDENGKVIPVTVIEAGPCVVVQKKTAEKDGYNAVQLGYEDIPERKLTKPEIMTGCGARKSSGGRKPSCKFPDLKTRPDECKSSSGLFCCSSSGQKRGKTMIVVECLYTSNEIEEETILREQQKRCLAAAASYGWAVRREVFEPLQLSARGMDDRTGIQTILDDVCNRRFDLLMIASMDRLSYDKEEVKAFLAEMDLNGISIFNVGSNTVTLASGWDLMAFIRQMISPENGGDAQ